MQVLGSFLTDDLLLKLNAVELMDASGPHLDPFLGPGSPAALILDRLTA